MTAAEMIESENKFFDNEIHEIINLLIKLGGSIELLDEFRLYPQSGMISISIISTDGDNIYLQNIDKSIKYSLPNGNYLSYRYDLCRPSYIMEKIEEYISSSYGSREDK